MNTKQASPMPYLSIVVASRHDTHGGNLVKRMALFMRSIDAYTKETQLHTELVVVEWNPPIDKPLLHEVLRPPRSNPYLSIRYLLVPPAIHRRYQSASALSIMQMIAKNIGIRRAKAPFILCSNVDIIFSRAIFHYLKKRPLVKGIVYRCNRCDIPNEVPTFHSMDDLMAYCKRHTIQRLGKNRWMPHLNPPGRFWYRNPLTLGMIAVVAQLIRPFMPVKKRRYLSLDTWACGDFTLMHKEDWMDIRGYFELDAYSIHLDSLALGSAVALGKKQVIWPAKRCIYHISHLNSWELQNPLRKIQFDVRMPRIDYVTLQNALRYMIQNEHIIGNQTQDWGYAGHTFTEYKATSDAIEWRRPKSMSIKQILV